MHEGRLIAHMDMDAFFAAIEVRDNRRLKGQPVVVGADPKAGRGRGVVSTCSYEARKFGIHSAMPIREAYRRAPEAFFLPVDMRKYRRVSKEIFDILYQFTPYIEPISIDEAFFDLNGTEKLFGSQIKTCRKIKDTIKLQTDLTCSIGLASIKMVAKIASDFQKPDGLVYVPEEKLNKFLNPLPIEKIWGIGPKSAHSLHKMKIFTIGDLASKECLEIEKEFGAHGRHIWQLANGIDERNVNIDTEIKSISHEMTFDKDTSDIDLVKARAAALAEKVVWRLRKRHFCFMTVTIKVRFADFKTIQKSITIAEPADEHQVCYELIDALFARLNIRKKIRLIGVRLSGLVDRQRQGQCFNKTYGKMKDISEAMDSIKNRFGEDSIHSARTYR